MPAAWWKGISKKSQSKSKSKSKSKPENVEELGREEEEEEDEERLSLTPKKHGKEKARSFDELLRNRDPSPVGARPGSLFAHPLPRPTGAAVAGPLGDRIGVAVSAPVSSVSSSVSSDEAPDFWVCRNSGSNTPRERNLKPESQRFHHVTEERGIFGCSPVLEHARSSDKPVSPRKEFHLFGADASSNGSVYSHGRSSTEHVFSSHRATTSSPGSRAYAFPSSPTSPIHPRAFSLCQESPTMRQDDLRSPPHPLPLPPSSPSSSTPRSLQSHWKKGKLLGRGTFGHVYQGFNSGSGQMCAIKEVTLISDDSNSKECLKQLNQEISLLSQLSHTNIVQYYGSELAEESLSVYLEYVSGGSIHKLLQEYGPFGEPVIRNYTAQILSGLAYLHGRNTVHRDIKGANILVDPNGEIKLADFGMAKHISSYTSIRSFKGSPYWMAPEVIMNSGGYNLSVDIWSLGCTILEMSTSKPPWSQYEGVAAIFKIGNSKDIPDIPDHFSPEGKKFLRLCLQRDPSARPTAAQLMDHPFVRDQAMMRVPKFHSSRDMLPQSSDGNRATINMEFSSRRSISPMRDGDYGMRHTVTLPSYNSSSDMASMRMNMSLPVSPCSSPLRQFKQSNRSCLPSPPHPAFSTGAISYGPNNYSLYPMRPSNTHADPWPEIAQIKVPTPYGSPRW